MLAEMAACTLRPALARGNLDACLVGVANCSATYMLPLRKQQSARGVRFTMCIRAHLKGSTLCAVTHLYRRSTVLSFCCDTPMAAPSGSSATPPTRYTLWPQIVATCALRVTIL